MTYRQWFRQYCAERGTDLDRLNVLREVTRGASRKGGGLKRILDITARDWQHQLKAEAAQNDAKPASGGRAA
ncbi:MAG: hypothetical protein IT430_03945 [Phycisphaerales bacterium]|nr:hypothetical protein [Phycisphaerales bacterium]